MEMIAAEATKLSAQAGLGEDLVVSTGSLSGGGAGWPNRRTLKNSVAAVPSSWHSMAAATGGSSWPHTAGTGAGWVWCTVDKE